MSRFLGFELQGLFGQGNLRGHNYGSILKFQRLGAYVALGYGPILLYYASICRKSSRSNAFKTRVPVLKSPCNFVRIS